MVKNILTVVLGLAGIAAVYVYVVPHLQNPNQAAEETSPIACTMDAKMCPDGTYVGRIPPNCDFEVCPIAETPVPPRQMGPKIEDAVVCPQDAKICPDGSGVGRVGPKCEFAPCRGER